MDGKSKKVTHNHGYGRVNASMGPGGAPVSTADPVGTTSNPKKIGGYSEQTGGGGSNGGKLPSAYK